MRGLIYGLVAAGCLAAPAVAQSAQSTLAVMQSNLQFREPIINGDIASARAAALTDAQKTCDALSKTLNMPCSVNNIRFDGNGPPFYNRQQQNPGTVLAANVEILLALPGSNNQ